MGKSEVEDLGCTPKGAHLFREPDGVGGYVYTSDEIGCGVTVWGTSVIDEGTLLMAMAYEHRRRYEEYIERQGKPLTPEMKMEQAAATGNQFLGTHKNKLKTTTAENIVIVKTRLMMGDVIILDDDECELVGATCPGKYLVEDAMESGGWFVQACKLDSDDKYCEENQPIAFHQCDGYKNVLKRARVVGCMQRVFV